MKTRILISICLISAFTQCGIFDTHLTKEDFEWVNMYNVGDTLVFKSIKDATRQNIVIVTKKNTRPYENHPPIGVDEICELHFEGNLDLFADLKSSTSPLGADLRIMYFKEGGSRDMNIGDTIVQNVPLKNVSIYKIPWVGVENEVEPKEVYWRKKDGIVAYVRRNGEMFIFYKKY